MDKTTNELKNKNQEKITELVRQLNEENIKLKKQYAQLTAFSILVNEAKNSTNIFKIMLKGMYDIIMPDASFLFLLKDNRLILKTIYPVKAKKRMGLIPEHVMGECLCGLAAKNKEAVFSNNIYEDLRCTWDECKNAGYQSFVAVPLVYLEEVLGVIGLSSDKKRDFGEEVDFLKAVAAQVALELKHLKLQKEVLAEREKKIILESELKESEKKFRTIADLSPVGIFLNNADGDAVYMNPKSAEMADIDADKDLGLNWAKNIHPDDKNRVMEHWMDCVKTGNTFTMEYRFLHPDGKVVWVLGRAVPVKSPQGKVLSFVGSLADITKRVEAMESLKISEGRLLRSQEVARIGTWEWNLTNDHLYWSDETHKRFDTDPEKFTPAIAYFVEHIRKEQRPLIQEAIQRALEKDEPFHVECWIKNDTGREWVMEAYGMVERDSENKPLFMKGTAQDVTERFLARKEIEKNEEQLRLLLDSAGDAMFLFDFDTSKIFFCNKQACRSLGYSREELLTKTLAEIDPQFIPDYHKEQLWKKMKPGEIQTLEVIHKRKDGSTFPVEVRTGIIYYHGKKAVLGFARDITERKKSEERLKQHQEHLEEMVRERTRELEKKNKELELLNNVFVGREFRIKELRDKVKKLEKLLHDN